jgi:hypothetical protein
LTILAELIQTGGEKLYPEVHKLIISIWNKKQLAEQWKKSVILPVYGNGDKSDFSNY